MRFRKPFLFVALTVAAATPVTALAAAAPAGAAGGPNLVKQGSFEFPVTGQQQLVKPGKHIGPWHVSVGPVAVAKPLAGFVTGTGGKNHQFLSLKDPFGDFEVAAGVACQTVPLDPAGSYRLHFSSAAATYADSMIVTWQGATVGTYADTASFGTTVWYKHAVNLGKAKGAASGTVCFSSTGDGYPLLDIVVIQAH